MRFLQTDQVLVSPSEDGYELSVHEVIVDPSDDNDESEVDKLDMKQARKLFQFSDGSIYLLPRESILGR